METGRRRQLRRPETGLVVRMVYKLAYRQTESFLHSIASLLGLGIEIPDYSTLCRRSRLLRKKLRIPKAASTWNTVLRQSNVGGYRVTRSRARV